MPIDDAWAWLTEPISVLPAPYVWGFFLLGCAAAFNNRVWRAVRLPSTLIHETGHALAAILVGRRVMGIKVHRDASGVTTHAGVDKGIGRAVVAAAGYPAPSIVGALLLALLLRDETRIAGAVVVIVLALLLPLQRSLLSFGISLAMIAGMLLVLLAVPTEASTLALAFVSGVLCVSSPRTIVELHRYRTRVRREQFTTGDAAQHSDADTLAELTHIPALIWEGVFLILSLAAVALAISNSR